MENSLLKEKFKAQYEKGLKLQNVGIPFPLTQLSSIVCNLQQSTYYVFGGGQGTGKSTLVNECFINYPLQWLQKNPDSPFKYHGEYFNLEISEVDVIAKFKANWIFRESQGAVKLSVNQIFQKGDFRLTVAEQKWIEKSEDYIDYLLDNVTFITGERVGSKYVYKRLWACAEKYGTMDRSPEGHYMLHTYKPKDPNQFVVVIFDNFNNLPDKEEIDKISQYFVDFRNACGFTFAAVQQYNRLTEGMDRREFMIPQLSDLMGTSKPGFDCNIALLTYAPARYMLPEYEGYNLKEPFGDKTTLGTYLKFARLAKSRDGRDDVYVPYMFSGARGYVKEMPEPANWNANLNKIKDEFKTRFT
jgi:hypothetical protein